MSDGSQQKSPLSGGRDAVVGIDVGGTFTDFVALIDGRIVVHKRSTTPDDPSRSIIEGMREMGLLGSPVVHGTTVATNALLERRGARTALVTTAGFADVLEIGRQNRPRLYLLSQHRPPPLVPSELRFEVRERMGADGRTVIAPDEEDVAETARRIGESGAESIAVVLLFSFADPAHEQQVAETLRRALPDLPVSVGHEILPEYREYERTSVTVVNAYVRPLVSRYLRHLADSFGDAEIAVMQSSGGTIGVEQASAQGARLVLSGPAGGVVGAFHIAKGVDPGEAPRIITFDMGGTSTDVSLSPGRIETSSEGTIAGLPLRLPAIDIHTVGAGGGSIAWVDQAGVLHAGPRSAGAYPGPACYGRGGMEPTVSDANLLLGRLDPAHFAGGAEGLALDREASRRVLTALGERLGMSAEETALGLIRVANAVMERALRRVSVERGYDPRSFTLVPFGGAGPLHACDLAAALGCRDILIPPFPGALSAFGMLAAETARDESESLLTGLDRLISDPGRLAAVALRLTDRAGEGIEGKEGRTEISVDLRYSGQSHELTVPLALPIDAAAVERAREAFHDLHDVRYGYARRGSPVEAVTVRARCSTPGPVSDIYRGAYNMPGSPADSAAAPPAFREVMFDAAGYRSVPSLIRGDLPVGAVVDGPALLLQPDTTTVLTPGWRARVDTQGNLLVQRSTSPP